MFQETYHKPAPGAVWKPGFAPNEIATSPRLILCANSKQPTLSMRTSPVDQQETGSHSRGEKS